MRYIIVMVDKKKAKNITLDILEFILSIPTATVDGFINKNKIINGYEENGSLTYDMRKWMSSLRQKGYLEESYDYKDKKGGSVRLTNKAKLRLFDKISNSIKNDGRYRFVSFDIPEEMRSNRDKFRRSIKRLGFVQIQRSLWVVDRNVGEYVELAAYENKVEKYVAYIVSEKSDIDGYIARLIKKKKNK